MRRHEVYKQTIKITIVRPEKPKQRFRTYIDYWLHKRCEGK